VYASRVDGHSAVVSSALAAAAGADRLGGWSDDGVVESYLAQVAEETGRYELALERSKAVPDGERGWFARLRAAAMLAKLGRDAEAEEAFKASLTLKPNDPDILSNLAVLIARRGQIDEAVERARAAAAMKPAVPQAPYRLGLILAAQGKTAEARASHEAALAVDPNFEPAKQALRELESARPHA